MMRLPMATLTLSLSLFAAAASAQCSREAAPAIPDGAVATLEDMKAAQIAVKAYMASGNAFLACLEEEGRVAGEEEAVEAKAARIASHNAAVDEQTDVATRFNAALQAFKTRN
jgi:hypothetical protein